MATNNFKVFASASSANIISQADYEALAALLSGFQSGKASSAQVNKALRQGTTMAAVLAQFIVNASGNDVLDNGNSATILTSLIAALKANITTNIGDGSALPFGVPVPYPGSTPPTGWLKYNGASFSGTLYPKLAALYPSLVLPDLRGMFIRGWDDGRGYDSGRDILSEQAHAIQNILGTFTVRESVSAANTGVSTIPAADGAFSVENLSSPISYVPSQATGSTGYKADVVTLDASTTVNTATETRPRNIAFCYIVRAA